VFKLTPNDGVYTETVLYRFSGGTDGAAPMATLIIDSTGNLFGTTQLGGGGSCVDGCGTVFRLAPSTGGTFTETVLYQFTGGSDGASPRAGLSMDANGNLYGTTYNGGGGGCVDGCGTVFKLAPTGNGTFAETVLNRFTGGTVGANPSGGLLVDPSAGNLYGTTFNGGGNFCYSHSAAGCGIVFQLIPNKDGTYRETVLHTFAGASYGSGPMAGLVACKDGNQYGTTADAGGGGTGGGAGDGTVFKLTVPPPIGTIVPLLPNYFPVLFGVADDSGGYGIAPGGRIVPIPPWTDDPIFLTLRDNMPQVVQALTMYEGTADRAANPAGAVRVTDTSRRQNKRHAVRASIEALRKMEARLERELRDTH
jgi:hypothetical protein